MQIDEQIYTPQEVHEMVEEAKDAEEQYPPLADSRQSSRHVASVPDRKQ
jgi:hypothetical protein